MDSIISILSEEWAIRGLIASSLVGIMCGVIGCFIVLRNMSLIGDALAHAILPGVYIAFIIVGYSTIGFFIGSVAAGLLTAFIITWVQHNNNTKNDAAIGIIFTAMFSLGVIGISYLSQEQGVHLDLKDFLFGTTLGVGNEDIYLTIAITIYTLLCVIIFYRYLFITTFQPTIAETMGISVKTLHYFLMLLLSFAVVAALRTVGLILVVAMLVTPPSTALLLSDRLKNVLILSGIIGFFTAISGFILAVILNAPPGPLMAVVATSIYLLTTIFAPRKGLLSKYLAKKNQRFKVEQEDILRQAIKSHQKQPLTAQSLVERLSLKKSKISKHLSYLKEHGLIIMEGLDIKLSSKGFEQAENLVRAHRLWESYQVQKMGLTEGQIHDEADRLEHLLTTELLDEVDGVLGYPSVDPHGSPIPSKKVQPKNPLLQRKPKDRVKISKSQINDLIESELWELGLLPNTLITIHSIGSQTIKIKNGSKTIDIPAGLASQINVDN